jgi:hypothetical protein
MTPEFDLLCLAARPRPDYARVAAVLGTGLEWCRLLSLAEAHCVRPQLIRALRDLDWISVPPEARQSLSGFLRLHKARSLFFAGQLVQVADQFSQRAIPFATFKGPSLAAAVYGDLSLREYNDIDIIVQKKHVAQAEEILGCLGYKSVAGSSAFRRAFLSYQGQFALLREMRESPKLAIDLHWDFACAHVPFPLSPREIWSNLEKADIGGRAVPTLGRSDLALFLAGHGTKEGWRCLGWVCDFAMFIETHPDLDWTRLLERARQRGSGRSLLLGCQLAAQLLGTRVKGDLLRFGENNAQFRLAAETVVRRIDRGFPARSSEHVLGDFELCQNWVQRTRFIGRLLFTRTAGDYISLPLPRPLWRVYHLTRPFRLAGKAITSLARMSPRRM